jgi:hypothetical protein
MSLDCGGRRISAGNQPGHVDVGAADCVALATILPAVIVPALLAVGLVALLAVRAQQRREEARWRIEERELLFCEPEEVLGVVSQASHSPARGLPCFVASSA